VEVGREESGERRVLDGGKSLLIGRIPASSSSEKRPDSPITKADIPVL